MDLTAYNIEPLDNQQFIWLSISGLCFLLTLVGVFLSRRNFLLLAGGVGASIGLVDVLVPSYAIARFTLLGKNPEIDGFQLYMVRGFGLMMVAEAVILYRLSDRDSDPTIFTSIVWSKVVMYTLLAVNLTYSYLYSGVSKSKSNQWTFNDIQFGAMVATFVGFTISGLSQLYFCPSWGGYPESTSRLNLHLRIDYFSMLLLGILTFALPHWFISLETNLAKPTLLHLYMARTLGIFMIGNGLFMGRAPNFLRDTDKVTLLEVRVVQNLLIILLQLYAQNWFSFLTKYHIVDVSGVALLTLNAAFGYWSVKGYPKFHSE